MSGLPHCNSCLLRLIKDFSEFYPNFISYHGAIIVVCVPYWLNPSSDSINPLGDWFMFSDREYGATPHMLIAIDP